MIYYPPRKAIGTLGFTSLALCILLIYRYIHLHKMVFAIGAILMLCIAVYTLGPFFRYQVVEIVPNGIKISSFGNKILLTADNLYNIEYDKSGIASFQFSIDDWYYQVTPKAYINSEKMLHDFVKVFPACKTKYKQKL